MMEMGLYAAVSPFALLLLSTVWKYPAVLEEVVKWGILRSGPSNGAVVGLVFGLSEAILYSMNAWSSGDWSSMVYRIILTVPMHTVTAMVTAAGMKRGVGYIGLAIAMVIHGLFNLFVR